MTQENICVTFTGPNKTDVLGYFNAQDNGENGVALGPDTQVRVNLSVTVNGHNFTLQTETDIPLQLHSIIVDQLQVFQFFTNGHEKISTLSLADENVQFRS